MKLDLYFSKDKLKDRSRAIKENLSAANPALAVSTKEGILLITAINTENHSVLVQEKIFKVYNRIAAVMIGYTEDIYLLRQKLIKEAIILGDLMYSPKDVSAEVLSLEFSKFLKSYFENLSARPFEIEAIISQVNENQKDDEIFMISFDGTIQVGKVVIIGNYNKDRVAEYFEKVKDLYNPNWRVQDVLNCENTSLFDLPDLKWEIKLLSRASLGEDEEFKNMLINVK